MKMAMWSILAEWGCVCTEGEGREEQQRQLASSPPPSWEDRAELMPEEQPFGVSWMETGAQRAYAATPIFP